MCGIFELILNDMPHAKRTLFTKMMEEWLRQ